MLNTPVDRIRCSLVGELRVPARVSSLSIQPSPISGRVGIHIVTFEACSSFTRVTACRVARLPYVSFITRPHPSRLPGSGARKLPSSTNNLLGWVLPPLVTCAVEAHPISPSNVHRRSRRVHADRLPRGSRQLRVGIHSRRSAFGRFWRGARLSGLIREPGVLRPPTIRDYWPASRPNP